MNESPRLRPHLPALPALVLVLLLAAGVLGGQLLRQNLVVEPHARAVAEASRQQVGYYATEINRSVAALRTRVDNLASEASQRLAGGETPAGLADWLEKQQSEIMALANLRLVDENGVQSLYQGNFVVLNLVAEASAGEQPRPRAARLDDWALYLAHPVSGGGDTSIALVAEATLAPLLQQVIASRPLEGRLRVLQHVNNQPSATLLDQGVAIQDAGEEREGLSVPDWELRFQPGAALRDRVAPGRLLYYLCLVGLWGGVAAGALWLIRRHGSWQPVRRRRRRARRESAVHEAVPVTAGELWQKKSQPEPEGEGKTESEPEPATRPPVFAEGVFRDYDIRGQAGSDIDSRFAHALGRVLGAMALDRSEHQLVVGRDGRTSSPELARALAEGILSTGCDVIDLGMVPTPVFNFCLNTLDNAASGVMVTASHNPAPDNGFKIIVNQHVLSSGEITGLRERMLQADALPTGQGSSHEHSAFDDYMAAVSRDMLEPAGLRVVIDCGNGVAGAVAPALFRKLGCDVIELYCDVDGSFPNHAPDPSVEANLAALVEQVGAHGADIGLAFDGDGDRVVAIAASGRIVWPDELLMIFARDLLARSPGADIVYDVKSTRRLSRLVDSYGGRPVMWKTGHAHMRNKMRETRAPVGGEFSGHLFFNDRWYGFDDGLYAGARLLEVMALREQSLDEIVDTFTPVVATGEIKVAASDDIKFVAMAALREKAGFEGAEVIKLDGLRVEYPDGWGLVRTSNTSPALTLRFEADNPEALARIQDAFRQQLQQHCSELSISF